jgi:hypothetical protein
MPRFLSPIYVKQEIVTGNETISGNETILGVTSGRTSYWTTVNSELSVSSNLGWFNSLSTVNLSTSNINSYTISANDVKSISAIGVVALYQTVTGVTIKADKFYGDGSGITGILASGGYSTDVYKLPLSGGTLTGGITGTEAIFNLISSAVISGTYYGDGSKLTGVINGNDTRLTNSRTPNGSAGGDLSGNYPNPTVSKIRGNTISNATPSVGQMLQWNGSEWTPGSIPTGGSGGGGKTYFLNYGVASDIHSGLSGTIYEFGVTTLTQQTSANITNVAQDVYTPIATFITDILDPNIITIPAGIWDANVWVSTTASNALQMILKVDVYTYNPLLSTTTLIATSDDLDIYDPTVIAQYTPSIVVPQTTVDLNDRIYIVLKVKSTAPNKDVTLYFGGLRPSHIHTTIPSVGGSGLVKVINGVFQTPASLLVDSDVDSNAQINQTKISGLTASLDSKFNKSGGTISGDLTVTGTFSTANTEKWTNTYNTTYTNSAKWDSVYSNVNSNSASWTTTVNLSTNVLALQNLTAGFTSTSNTVSTNSAKWDNSYSTVNTNSASWTATVNLSTNVLALQNLTAGFTSTSNTVSTNSAKWESVYSSINSNSATYVTLTGTQTLTNKTVIDWMTLVRGYNTTPVLLATIPSGEVYTYVYTSSPSNITYYRFISTDGSTDAFYTYFSGTTLSGVVASKSIIL